MAPSTTQRSQKAGPVRLPGLQSPRTNSLGGGDGQWGSGHPARGSGPSRKWRRAGPDPGARPTWRRRWCEPRGRGVSSFYPMNLAGNVSTNVLLTLFDTVQAGNFQQHGSADAFFIPSPGLPAGQRARSSPLSRAPRSAGGRRRLTHGSGCLRTPKTTVRPPPLAMHTAAATASRTDW